MRASERLAEELLNSLDQELLVSSLRDSAFEFGEEMKVQLRSNVLGEDGGELGRTDDVRSSGHALLRHRILQSGNLLRAHLHRKEFSQSSNGTIALRPDRMLRRRESNLLHSLSS